MHGEAYEGTTGWVEHAGRSRAGRGTFPGRSAGGSRRTWSAWRRAASLVGGFGGVALALAGAAVAQSAGPSMCTVQPPLAEPGAFGAAVALSEGRLWVGPARDADLGAGPPQVWALGLATTEGECLGRARIAIRHPKGDARAAFGAALAARGRHAVIGAPAAIGAGGAWGVGEAFLAELTDAGGIRLVPLGPTVPQAGARFGAAVALSDGWIAVASPHANAGAVHSGAVDLFQRVRVPGAGDAVRSIARLAPPGPAASGWFGASVALHGETLAVGEPGHGDGFPSAGLVHVYRLRGGRWTLEQTLRAPAGASGWHGASVALAGDCLLAGAPLAVRALRGAVAIHQRVGGAWRATHAVHPPCGGHAFGCAVALDAPARQAAIGSSADSGDARSPGAPYGGAAWLLDLRTGTVERVPCPPPAAREGLGQCVAADDGWVAVGVGGDPEASPPPPGRVHLLRPAFTRWRSPSPRRAWRRPRRPP